MNKLFKCQIIALSVLFTYVEIAYSADLVTTFDVGRRASDIEFSPNGDTAYVNNFDGNTVSVIDTGQNRVVATIRVGEAPNRPVAATNSRVYVPNGGRGRAGNGTVSVIDTSSNRVIENVEVGVGPSAGATTFVRCNVQPCINDRVLITNFNRGGIGSVSVIDTEMNRVVRTIEVGKGPIDIDIPFLGRKAYVANNNGRTVTVIDIPRFNVVATIPVPGYPTAIFADANSNLHTVFVSHNNPNGISAINTQQMEVSSTLITSYKPRRVASPVVGTVNHILVPIFTEDRVDRIDFPRRVRVETITVNNPRGVGINFRHRGHDTYVVGNNQVKVFNSGFAAE